MKKGWGFTIVELLIVIAVIGILSAIVLTTYNGVQQRAFNTRIVSAVKLYEDALKVYRVQNSRYPAFNYSVCLGETYPDRNGDGVGDCGPDDGNRAVVNAAFNAELKKVINSLPPVETTSVKTPWSETDFVGVQLVHWDEFRVDGESQPYFMVYVLKGADADCGLPRSVTAASEGSFPDMVSGARNNWYDTGTRTTECRLSLPN